MTFFRVHVYCNKSQKTSYCKEQHAVTPLDLATRLRAFTARASDEQHARRGSHNIA